MRYTHLSVGHPATLRRMARDSLGTEFLGNGAGMVGGSDCEDDDGEGYEGYSNDDEETEDETDEEPSEDELECKGEGLGSDDGYEEEDEFDDLLSF